MRKTDSLVSPLEGTIKVDHEEIDDYSLVSERDAVNGTSNSLTLAGGDTATYAWQDGQWVFSKGTNVLLRPDGERLRVDTDWLEHWPFSETCEWSAAQKDVNVKRY